ncbi:MAG: S-adenosyl-l-methionine hydroxide adenosyltransferase family protein [Promethearchaeota archaeon]
MNEQSQAIIALLTDFGRKGQHYIASMKGVILNINPFVKIIDISHEITPFSIIEASYMIKSCYKHFPSNTIFIVVVDPDVGSHREILALKTSSNHYFIGPNNGIFSNAIKPGEIKECFEVNNEKYFSHPVSHTFHGRDIMAPVAAHLTKGLHLSTFGPLFDSKNILKYPLEYQVDPDKKKIRCSVCYIDSFGNITTNVPIYNNRIINTSIELFLGALIRIRYNSIEFSGRFQSHFSTEPKGAMMFLTGSSGYLEISKNQEDASKTMGCKIGDIMTIFLE